MRSFALAASLFVLDTIGCATAQTENGTHGDAHADSGLASETNGSDATDSAIDSATDTRPVDASDSGTDAIDSTTDETDASDDSATETAVDTGIDVPPGDGGITTVTFPTATSTVHNSAVGTTGTLGAGGGGAYYVVGTYCEQSFPRVDPVTRLDLDFKMSDLTTGCSAGKTLSWNVKLNGTTVGSYNFTSTSPAHGDRSIVQSYTFAAIAAAAGSFTIRLEATSTVCPGGSSWNWYPGGTAKMQ